MLGLVSGGHGRVRHLGFGLDAELYWLIEGRAFIRHKRNVIFTWTFEPFHRRYASKVGEKLILGRLIKLRYKVGEIILGQLAVQSRFQTV